MLELERNEFRRVGVVQDGVEVGWVDRLDDS
jgi:hypothetical protein